MDGVGRITESTITRTHTHKHISNHDTLQCVILHLMTIPTRTVSMAVPRMAGDFTRLVLFGFPHSLNGRRLDAFLAGRCCAGTCERRRLVAREWTCREGPYEYKSLQSGEHRIALYLMAFPLTSL